MKARSRGKQQRTLELRVRASTLLKVVLAVIVAAIAVRIWIAFLLFLLAVLIAITLDPLVRRMEQRGLRRRTGVLVIAAIFAAVAVAVVVLIVPALTEEISVFVRDYATTRDGIGRDIPDSSPILKAFVAQILTLPDSPEVRAWFTRPLVWGRVAVEIASGGILVLVMSLYLLIDGQRAYTWILSYVPRRHRIRVAETVPPVTEVVRSYVRGQFLTSLACGVFTFLLLTILRIPAALALAAAALILDVIPILGTIAMTVPAALLALTVSPLMSLVVIVAYVLYHLFESYVIAPRIYGSSLRLSSLTVLLALVTGGLLQGVLGAVLVLPLAAAYPIIERIWLAKYLGTDVVKDHTALAASLGTEEERAVERAVILGERHAPEPPAGSPPAVPADV